MKAESELTARRKEAVEMMRQGWQLVVLACWKRSKPKAYLVRQPDSGVSEERSVPFSTIEGLQQLRLVDAVRSQGNNRTWLYALVDQTPAG